MLVLSRNCARARSCAERARTRGVEHHRPGSSGVVMRLRCGRDEGTPASSPHGSASSTATASSGCRVDSELRVAEIRSCPVPHTERRCRDMLGPLFAEHNIRFHCSARDVDQGACLLAMASSFANGWKCLRILAAFNHSQISEKCRSSCAHRSAEHLPSLRALSLGAWAVTHQARLWKRSVPLTRFEPFCFSFLRLLSWPLLEALRFRLGQRRGIPSWLWPRGDGGMLRKKAFRDWTARPGVLDGITKVPMAALRPRGSDAEGKSYLTAC